MANEQSESVTRNTSRYPDGYVSTKGHWMNAELSDAPTIFLVEQQPNVTAITHFHRNNQFQVFVDGDGSIGPRKIGPVVVHYAGAYTAYGPIKAGPRGLKYFTIRLTHEAGAQPVENSGHEWLKGPRCHFTSKPLAVPTEEEMATLSDVLHEAVRPDAGDSLAVETFTLPPDTTFVMPPLANAAGRFLIVLEGSAEVGGEELFRWESAAITEETPRSSPARQALTFCC